MSKHGSKAESLEKWQTVSFISRMIAMFLGIAQSFIIVRILTIGEFGIIQIALGIGGIFGITQHLGLAAGATREIAATDDDKEAFKIFITSLVIRYMITLPLAFTLLVLAERLAINTYNNPLLIAPLKLYALVMLVQGAQSILNSVIAGTKRFKQLFLYQALIPLISIALYIPLVYLYGLNGYFYALLLFTTIGTVVLGLIAFKPMRGSLVLPTKKEFFRLFNALLSVGLGVYFVKMLFTLWESAGKVLLGVSVTPEMVGIFGLALLYARKLMHVSDSVTDVNLPVFSEKFEKNLAEFKALFSTNFNKVFSLIVFAGMSAIFWSEELVLFLASAKYQPALALILPLTFVYIFYSLINILKSSIFVPAKLMKELIAGYILLLVITIGFYTFTTAPEYVLTAGTFADSVIRTLPGEVLGDFRFYHFLLSLRSIPFVNAMSLGMLLGVIVSFTYLVLSSQRKLKFKYITHDHVLILLQAFVISLAKDIDNFWFKILAYLLFAGLFVSSLFVTKFVSKKDVNMLVGKTKRVVTKIAVRK